VERDHVRGSDGTDLMMWRNGGSGAPVVVSNGLGAPPDAWPGITDADSGFEVVGWSHRGTAVRSDQQTRTG